MKVQLASATELATMAKTPFPGVTNFWMYGPQREQPCPMCTNWLGSVNGNGLSLQDGATSVIRGL